MAVGQNLNDTFTYSVTDGTNFTEATVTVTIAGENDVPISTADVARAKENGDKVLIDIFYNDKDVDTGDTLSLHMPAMVTEQGATLTTVAADRVVLGGTLEAGDTYAVVVTIGGQATTLTRTVTASDSEIADVETGLIELINTHDTLSNLMTATSGPANGVILISAKNSSTTFSTAVTATDSTGGDFDDATATVARTTVVAYDPDTVSDFNAMTTGDKVVDNFSYKALDTTTASDHSSIAATRVNITGSGANDRPNAVSESQAVEVIEDGSTVSIDVLANDTDADAVDTPDTLILNSVTSAKGASVKILNDQVFYDPKDVDAFQSLGAGRLEEADEAFPRGDR